MKKIGLTPNFSIFFMVKISLGKPLGSNPGFTGKRADTIDLYSIFKKNREKKY